jgi:hypothetical protein
MALWKVGIWRNLSKSVSDKLVKQQSNSPIIEYLDFVLSTGIDNPKQVGEQCLEDSEFKLMEQIGDKHLIEIESVLEKSLRKCVLDFEDLSLRNLRNIQEGDSPVLE